MYPGEWAKKCPEKIAVVDSVTGDALSYSELDSKSNQLAHFFRAQGIEKGDHIALFGKNDIKFFEISWAAFRSGIYLTPVNCLLKSDEVSYIVNNSNASLVICDKRLEDICKPILSDINSSINKISFNGHIDGYENYEDVLGEYSEEPLEDQPKGTYMFYSSGTTGRPKGVKWPLPDEQIGEDSAHFLFHRELWSFDEDTISICSSPLHHAAPAYMAMTTHAFGGTLVMMPKFDAEEALRVIEKYRVTHGQWVPTQFIRMHKLPEKTKARYDLSSMKFALHAAAPCPVELKEKMFDWWGPVFYEYYSGSEGVGMTHARPEEWLKFPGTVGKPLMGTLHICDEDGTELSIGEIGKVYFESDHEFTYHQDEKKRQNAQHPDSQNWTSLGDIGYVNEEGYLFLTDREQFLIISGGVNIYPREVEDTLVMRDDILDVAVIGVADDEMGEQVKALIQLAPGTLETESLEDEMIQYCRSRIAHYKCPRSIAFVASLPRSDSGKLVKRYL